MSINQTFCFLLAEYHRAKPFHISSQIAMINIMKINIAGIIGFDTSPFCLELVLVST